MNEGDTYEIVGLVQTIDYSDLEEYAVPSRKAIKQTTAMEMVAMPILMPKMALMMVVN